MILVRGAGSHTEPGGYTGAGNEKVHQTVRGRILELAADNPALAPTSGRSTNATGQFEIADNRSPAEIADRVRLCLRHAPADRLVFAPDCGLSQTARWAAQPKLRNMVAGVRQVRGELGL